MVVMIWSTVHFDYDLFSQAKSYIESLPKMEKKDLCKVFSTANPQGTTRSGFFFYPICFSLAVKLWSDALFALFRQPCPCCSACCCWIRRTGWAPPRGSRCLTSRTTEIRRGRRKRSRTTTRWTTRTWRWASGNVRMEERRSWGRDQWKDGGRRGQEEDDLSSFIDHCPAVLFFFFLGHTFTEILTFKPVVIDPKETSLWDTTTRLCSPGTRTNQHLFFFFIILIWTEITELSRSNSRFSHKYQAGSCFWSFLPDSSMLQLSCCTSGNNILWWVTQSSGSCGWYYMS